MDNGGILELNLLNTQMGMVGISTGCEVRYYTRTIVYGVKFGPSGAFSIEKINRFIGSWEDVMFSGTLNQTTSALNSFGPFISLDEIMVYWGGLSLPPEPPNTNFVFNPA